MKKPDASAIRLIATDLDETLLHKDKAFSDYSRQVLKKLIDKGYLVVPASGRDLKRMCENILTMQGIRYAITLNGAQVYELPGEAVSDSGTEIRPVRRVGEFPLSEEEAVLSLDWMRPYCNILEMDTDQGLLREVTVIRPGCFEALSGEPLTKENAEATVQMINAKLENQLAKAAEIQQQIMPRIAEEKNRILNEIRSLIESEDSSEGR